MRISLKHHRAGFTARRVRFSNIAITAKNRRYWGKRLKVSKARDIYARAGNLCECDSV